MKFYAGDKVTYLDILNAVVMHVWPDSITITFKGRGLITGEDVVIRARHNQLVHGWHAKQLAYDRSFAYDKSHGYSVLDHLHALHVG